MVNDTFPLISLGVAPESYDRRQMARLLRAIELQLQLSSSRGPIRCSTINISDLPTSATGLKSGDVWNDAGTLKIA